MKSENKTTSDLNAKCVRIKRRATLLLWNEHVGQGKRMPAARRAWRFACDVQNRMAVEAGK
jgi:hypothetical protein